MESWKKRSERRKRCQTFVFSFCKQCSTGGKYRGKKTFETVLHVVCSPGFDVEKLHRYGTEV